jgi:NADH-ubiquinone oxidoreductase chain 6
MNQLYILYETYTNGYRVETLDIISLIAILCGILVIISKNPIVSVLFLIGLFLSISGYLIILGLNFIGLSYLLVYVGAVSILFLFILMLINVRISELLSNTNNSIPLAILVSILFSNPVYNILPYSIIVFNTYILNLNKISDYFFGNIMKINNINLDNGQMYFVTSKV